MRKTLLPYLALLLIAPLKAQVKSQQETKVTFEKVQLLDEYITEGASIGDIDGDGHMDIVAGTRWWKGPDFNASYAYGPVKEFAIPGYADNFFNFPGDFDGDEWTDVLLIGLAGSDSKWVKNPGESPLPVNNWTEESVPTYRKAQDHVGHESPNFVNVIGDDKQLLSFSEGKIMLGIPGSEDDVPWKTLAISPHDPERFPNFSHGLGTGDVNNDGLKDVLEKNGWWEQPRDWDEKTPWVFHEYPFSPDQGGAQMFAFDVDGDGDNDVVTAMNGHGYGLSWYEQVSNEESCIDFEEHQIMTDNPADNLYGVSFSQLHAMDIADIDNDGIDDIITGKCYYAHDGRDPGAEHPAVLYWFKTFRNADGTVEFIPYLIDDDSGVGRQISTGDLNSNGKTDIVVGNKKGVFVFFQKKE